VTRRLAVAITCVASAFVAGHLATAQSRPPYLDSARSVDERVRDLVGRMTPAEKFWQLYMTPGDPAAEPDKYREGIFGVQLLARANAARMATEANKVQRHFVERTRLGIPAILFEEAVHGLMQDGATVYPQAIALGATWDTDLVGRIGSAIAKEARSRGVRQVLSPVINIANDVRWGRVEETYGEDPLLASAMGLAFIIPFERASVITTPKHFIANVGDGGRDSYPIQYSQRLLEETFFPPFEAAIRRGGARSVMTAYNSVDGSPATQSRRLLNDTLKRHWGFTGFVISDAAATGGATVLHMTEPDTPVAAKHAFDSGLDVVFQSTVDQHRPYWQAFERGMIDKSVIDAAVARVLRAKVDLGLFEHPYVDVAAAELVEADPAHRALALEAARASLVLLKNERQALPLKKTLRSVAVIGADAIEARLGGYSVPSARKVSILDGIREKLGAAAVVRFAPGPGREALDFKVVPAEHLRSDAQGGEVVGLRGEYFENLDLEGPPRIVRTDPTVAFDWTLSGPARDIDRHWYSARWTGRLVAPTSGIVRLGVAGNDGYRLWLDGKLLIDRWRKQSNGASLQEVRLERGRTYALRLEYFETRGNGHIRLVWDVGVPRDRDQKITEAVAVAENSDAAIVVAGIEEGEFRDRSSLRLPGQQEDLIRAVARTGKPVVVVLIGGSAITMSGWLDQVGAVLHAWYPGEQGGRAVADVLFGDFNPSGRLPITFPLAEGQLPLVYNHKPTGRGDDYLDLTGQPLFPFGFGLSYSAFTYSALSVTPAVIGASQTATVRCRVRNQGPLPGAEVVQLYIRDELASVAQPVISLQGFRRIKLDVGEEREVTFTLGPAELSLLDESLQRTVEPGAFRVMIGASSRDLRLRGTLTVRQP
jgi:beta-glucosidase